LFIYISVLHGCLIIDAQERIVRMNKKIRELGMRLARLERRSSTMDFFKSSKSRAIDIINEINKTGASLSPPEKLNRKSNQVKATFTGYGLREDDVSYEITFLKNDIYRDPFEYGIGDLYESGSFTFYINKKAVATARSPDRDFVRKVKKALPY
jgi:hypothetical protein